MNLREFAFSKNQKIYKYIKSVLKEDSFPPYIYNNSTSAYLDLDKAYSTTTSILCSRPALTIYLQGIQFLHLTLFSAKITIITDMDVYLHLQAGHPALSTFPGHTEQKFVCLCSLGMRLPCSCHLQSRCTTTGGLIPKLPPGVWERPCAYSHH